MTALVAVAELAGVNVAFLAQLGIFDVTQRRML